MAQKLEVNGGWVKVVQYVLDQIADGLSPFGSAHDGTPFTIPRAASTFQFQHNKIKINNNRNNNC